MFALNLSHKVMTDISQFLKVYFLSDVYIKSKTFYLTSNRYNALFYQRIDANLDLAILSECNFASFASIYFSLYNRLLMRSKIRTVATKGR